MVEINGNIQANLLEAWQGSYGTGPGYMAVPRRKKQEPEEKETPAEAPEEGVSKDGSGVVHVDIKA